MRVGLSLTLSGTIGKHSGQTTLGWSAVTQKDETEPRELEDSEDVDLTSERIPVGFRVIHELEEGEDE